MAEDREDRDQKNYGVGEKLTDALRKIAMENPKLHY